MAAVSTPSIARAMAEKPSPSPSLASLGSGSFGAGGDISLEGQIRVADVDRQFQQQRGPTQQTLDAVDDLGLDPSGGEPINDTFESEISGLSNARVEFPSDGVFTVTGQMVIRPAGPIELIGNGCTFKLQSDIEHRILNIDGLPSGSLIQGFAFESTGTTTFGNRIATDGTVRLQDFTYRGYMRSDQSNPNNLSGLLSPVAESSSATVQVRNMTAIGGTPAGTHDDDDLPDSAPENQIASPMGVWVGKQTQGTVQLVECQLRGWSNAVYAGRTSGRVEVAGGTYYNNLNSQLRLGGGSIIDGATLILDDREWSMDENPGPYSLGENQGVYAIRVDTKNGGVQSEPLQVRNVEIQAKSMGKGAAVIEFEDISAPGKFQNCRIMNHLDRPVIRALPPSGGSPQNIMVTNSLIGGSSPAAVMEIQNRRQSRIQQTCVAIPDAGPDDINGAQIGEDVTFGQQCKGTGLAAPKKVGSGGNISSLPAPTNSGSSPGFFEGIANYVIGGFKDLTRGLLKGFAAILIAPFLVLVVLFLLLFGPLLVVFIFLIAGRKSLKE